MARTDPPLRRLIKRIGFLGKKAFGLGLWPDFIVIGGAKCASTAFYNNLGQHPEVIEARRKELHYFDTKYRQGERWYRANFPSAIYRRWSSGCFVTGEASPFYISHPHAPRRVRDCVPNAKLIALLRNPIDRAYSMYQHMVRNGREKLSFEEAIEKEEKRLDGEREKMLADPDFTSLPFRFYSYKARGCYADQLNEWTKCFPREQLLILRTEDYRQRPDEVMSRALEFLGIPPWDGFRHERHNVGGYDTEIDPRTREELRAYFKPYNERLYEFLGEDWGWA